MEDPTQDDEEKLEMSSGMAAFNSERPIGSTLTKLFVEDETFIVGDIQYERGEMNKESLSVMRYAVLPVLVALSF